MNVKISDLLLATIENEEFPKRNAYIQEKLKSRLNGKLEAEGNLLTMCDVRTITGTFTTRSIWGKAVA